MRFASIALYPGAGSNADGLIEACRDALRQATAEHAVVVRGGGRDLEDRPASARSTKWLFGSTSKAMRPMLKMIERVAGSTIPLLIRGASGAGKEVVARAIHERSDRASAPLAFVSCAAMPASLLERALFDQDKGAFCTAAGGTILLLHTHPDGCQ